jgi:hypothetical protein
LPLALQAPAENDAPAWSPLATELEQALALVNAVEHVAPRQHTPLGAAHGFGEHVVACVGEEHSGASEM